jgi:hypothetical protein
MTRYGVKLCQRLDKVEKLRDQRYMNFLGYSRFMNDFRMKKEWIPQPRETWVSLPGKEGHKG